MLESHKKAHTHAHTNTNKECDNNVLKNYGASHVLYESKSVVNVCIESEIEFFPNCEEQYTFDLNWSD